MPGQLKFLLLRSRVVMHQLEKVEGELTDVKKRALRDFAEGAVAQEGFLHVGPKIDPQRESVAELKKKGLVD